MNIQKQTQINSNIRVLIKINYSDFTSVCMPVYVTKYILVLCNTHSVSQEYFEDNRCYNIQNVI